MCVGAKSYGPFKVMRRSLAFILKKQKDGGRFLAGSDIMGFTFFKGVSGARSELNSRELLEHA